MHKRGQRSAPTWVTPFEGFFTSLFNRSITRAAGHQAARARAAWMLGAFLLAIPAWGQSGPEVTFTAGFFEADEGSAVEFVVTMSEAPSGTVEVGYAHVDENPTATPGSGSSGDYTTSSGALTFTNPGALTQTITVQTRNDTDTEGVEYFSLRLSVTSGTAQIVGFHTAYGVILDNDSPPLLVFRNADGMIAESLSGAEDEDITYSVGLGSTPTKSGGGTGNAAILLSAPTGVTISSTSFTLASETVQPAGYPHIAFYGDPSLPPANWFRPKTVTVRASSVIPQGSTETTINISHGPEVVSDLASSPVPGVPTAGFNTATAYESFTAINLPITITEPPPLTFEFSASEYEGEEGGHNSRGRLHDNLNSIIFTVEVTAGTVSDTVTVDFATSSGTAIHYSNSDDPTKKQDYLPVPLIAEDEDRTVLIPGNLTFASGETIQYKTVFINGDDSYEHDELFTVTLSNASSGTVGAMSVATGKINDDDDPPTAAIMQPQAGDGSALESVTEGDTIIFTVIANATSSREMTVAYAAAGTGASPAASGTDFAATSGTLTLTPNVSRFGESGVTQTFGFNELGLRSTEGSYERAAIFTIPITIPSDTDDDDGETFTFSLTAITNTVGDASIGVLGNLTVAAIDSIDPASRKGGAIGAPLNPRPAVTSVTLTINEPQPLPEIQFTQGEYTVTEGDVHSFYRANRSQTVVPDLETVVLPVQVTGTVSSPVTVNYATSNVTAIFHPNSGQAQDYVSKSGTLTFTSSPSAQTITIQLSGDDSDEPDERFRVSLSNPSGAELGTTSVATVVIEDDDEAPIVAILGDDSRTVFEGETITFTVVAATTSSREVTVGYGVTSGSAVAGDDVPEVGGILTIAAHGTDLVSGTTSVHRGNSAYESTPKFPIAIAIPVDDVADAGETFTFSLTAMPDTVDGLNNARVENIASIHGTGGSHRHVSIDDLPPNDRARDRYGPAVTSVTVTIRETVIVEFTRGGYTANEGHHDAGESGEIVFTVEATGIIAAPLEIAYATAPGTALDAPKTAAGEGIDFYANSGTITFMPDEVVAREIEITVALRGDDSYEPNETFTMTISDPDSTSTAGLQIGSRPTATGTVRNDDPVPTLAILGPSEQRVREGHSIVFTVVSSATSSRNTDFSYRTGNTSPISADPNVDYPLLPANDNRFYMNGPGGVLSTNRSLSGSARLLTSYGDTATLEITVNTIADQVDDPDEQFIFAIETRSVGADPTHELNPARVGSVAAGETLGRIVGPATNEVTVTIINADTASTLSIRDAGSVREGDALIFNMRLTDPAAPGESITAPAGGITGTYSISRVDSPTDPYHAAATSDYAAPDDGTATNDGGYTGVTFTIPEGRTMYPIRIETNDLDTADGTARDTGHESDETFRVTLTTVATTGVTIDANNNAATGTILDNDEPPVVSIGLVGDAARGEGAGNVLFTVSVATTSSNPLVISYAPASGSTAGAADTAGATGSLTIPAFPYLDAVPTARLADDAPNYPTVADLRWTITVALVDDEASERPETLTLQLTSPDPSIATISETAGSADLTINDNDPGLLLLDESGGVLSSIRVDEGGTSTYQVVLVAPPDADVTVNITEQGSQALTLSAASLVFDNTNWDTARTVTITGTPDADADDGMATLVHSVTSTATGYASLSDYNLAVTIVDGDEVADLVFTDADGEALGDPPVLAVAEGGTTEYAVALFSQPTAPVTLTVSSSDDAKATVAPAALTFTMDNWDTAQPLTASGLDDPDSVSESLRLTHDIASTGDIRYNALSDIVVRITVNDDEVPGLRFTPAALSVGEGSTATYAVRLSTLPNAAVTVDIDITPNADAVTGATPQSLVFTTDNWNMDRQVTVTAASDADDLNETATLTHAVSSTDINYNALADQEVETVVVDDERSGLHLTPSAISVDEQDTATYAARLSAQPSAPVTIDIAITPQGGAVTGVTPQSLVFTTDNWDTDRPVTVTGGADDDARDDMATLTHAISSTDADYGALEDVTAVVTVTDNDLEGVRLTPEEVSVNEDDTATYAVRLTARPGAPVTIDIDITPQGGTVTGVTPQSLVFTTDNWSVDRQVTVTAGSDDDARDDTATIIHDVSSTDIYYDALADEPVKVTVVDDDEGSITIAPSSIAMGEEESATYTVVLDTIPIGDVEVTIALTGAGQQKATVDRQTLTFTASDWNAAQTVTLSALADEDGANEVLTVTHTPSGSGYARADAATLVVTIADDDAPQLIAVRLAADSGPARQGGDTYGVGEQIQLVVEFSRPVVVRGTPQLKIRVGENERLADYAPPEDGTNSAILTFAYTVQPDDEAPEGIEIRATPIFLDGDDAIVDAGDETKAATTDLAEDEFEVDIPVEATKVDGGKDFVLSAHAGDDQGDDQGKVVEDTTVTLDGTGSKHGELDADNITYAWKQKDGAAGGPVRVSLVDADKPKAIFNAPNLKSGADFTFVLTVANTRTDQEATDEVTVSVEADNDAPTAEAGEARDVQEGSTVTLDGSASTDPEGEALTYSWELESGGDESMVTNPKPADMDAEVVTFTLAVNIPGGTELTFELTVTDPEGLSHTDPVTITVTSTPFEKVLGHALSRFGRALGASAVDTLGERFGSTSKRALDTASINLGNTDLASLARWMPVNAAPPQAMHGGGLEHGMSMAIAGDVGAFGLPGGRMAGSGTAANNAAASGPVTANHFDERLRGGGRPLPIPQLPDRNALLHSSFEIGLSGNPEAGNSFGGLGGIDWTLWGRFDSRTFKAAPEEGSMTLEGSTTIGYVGVDGCVAYCTGVLGIALGSASSDVEFDDDGLEGDIGLSMLGFYPYGSWEFSPSLSAWGLVGMGSGSAEITSDMKHELEADIGMLMLAAGAYQDLGYWWDLVDLALKGDVFMVNTSADAVDGRLSEVTASVQRIRAGLEVSQSWLLSDGLLALPSLAFSGRMDGGDAETGFGTEFDAGLALKHQSGLSAEVHGRFLLMHQEEGISESGLSVMVHYDPGTPGGLAFALSPTWGDTASVGNALWNGDRLMLGGLANTQHHTTTSGGLRPDAMHVELQYGVMLRNWLVTPYGTRSITGSGSGNERWGLRIRALEMQPGEFTVDIFGQQGGSQADASVTPGVQGTLRLPLR